MYIGDIPIGRCDRFRPYSWQQALLWMKVLQVIGTFIEQKDS